MQIKHTGQPYRHMYVSDSYQRVIDNIDNFPDLTGIMTPYAQESFTDAITKASTYDTTIVVDKTVAISDDLTIPSNVYLIIRNGGSFSIDAGKTLTINGRLDSSGLDYTQIFTGAGDYAYTTTKYQVGPITWNDILQTENSRVIRVDALATNLTGGCRQGVLALDLTRSSSYPQSATDGNSDILAKFTVTNRSASGTYNRIRVMEVTGDLRDASASSNFVEAAQFCGKTRSGTTVVDVTVARFVIDNGATASGNIVGVQVQDVSQSATGTTYGILLNTSSLYAITREFGIFIDANAGSWVNAISFNGTITNVFDFEDNDGTNGATTGTYSSNKSTDPTGDIRVDVEGATKYLYLYANKPAYS